MNYSRLQLRSKKSISKSINAKNIYITEKIVVFKIFKRPKKFEFEKKKAWRHCA